MSNKSKVKQPYIPLYIGDWLKDTNMISLEAEGALLKLVFKLWDSPNRGIDQFSFEQLSVLLKKGAEMTEKIIKELHKNNVLDITFLPDEMVKIESRRMLKDIEKSRSASERGKKGGRPVKAKLKLNESKHKATPDNDSDNDSLNNKGAENQFSDITNPTGNVIDIFFNDLENSSHFENIARNLILTKDQLKVFIPKFRPAAELEYVSFERFATHFQRWVGIQLRTQTTPTKKRDQLL